MKDYKDWMPIKADINNSGNYPDYNEREIWVCNLGDNVGHEQDGKGERFTRPVLILKSYNQRFCHVIPLSTTDKRNRFYFAFNGHTGKESVALLSQSKALSTSRLNRKIGYISDEDFLKLKQAIRELLSL